MNERDLDAEFERIIAGWDVASTDPTPPRGLAESAAEVPDEPRPDAARGVDRSDGDPLAEPGGTAGLTVPGSLDLPIAPAAGHTWRGSVRPSDNDDAVLDAVPSDDPNDDHFIPPTETDLPTAEDDPMFWAIVVGLAGGLLLLLYISLFDRDGSGWWVVTSISMIGVGFVLLVLRGGTERDPSDDGTRI